MRVVFDTNTVVSALLFSQGRLAWLRRHWRSDRVIALASHDTVDELIRVLSYTKFQLERSEIETLLGDYLPFVELAVVEPGQKASRCCDRDDQIFVDLAVQAAADCIVSGDRDLLEMKQHLRVIRHKC